LRAEDGQRLLDGAAALRVAVAEAIGAAPGEIGVDRTCSRCAQQHGRPRLVDSTMNVSVSYAGEYVLVATSNDGPVGVDAERIEGTFPAGLLLAADEPAHQRDLARYWVRKESVVKATGAGILTDLREVRVGPASGPARLRSYLGRPLLAFMADLAAPAGYCAALTLLGPDRATVSVDDVADQPADVHPDRLEFGLQGRDHALTVEAPAGEQVEVGRRQFGPGVHAQV
jgi:4'-phosphopantetheinyl transferase